MKWKKGSNIPRIEYTGWAGGAVKATGLIFAFERSSGRPQTAPSDSLVPRDYKAEASFGNINMPVRWNLRGVGEGKTDITVKDWDIKQNEGTFSWADLIPDIDAGFSSVGQWSIGNLDKEIEILAPRDSGSSLNTSSIIRT